MDKKTDLLQTSLRPQFYNDINQWSLKIMNEFFYNNNAPNLENVGNRYVGKGASYFTSVNLSYLGKYFVFTFEPFYFRSQNKIIKHLNRGGQFDYLNDIRHEDSTPYIIYGLRESQLYLRYGEVGFGYSNANMWLGPGIHTSLTMSNNTTGFPHFMIGTIKEKKYNNIGINTRYVISQLKDIKSQPFYSALYGTISIYTEPIITIGFNRNLLFSKIINGKQIKKIEAILKLFDELDNVEGTYQTIISYFIFDFPKSNLKVFFELGTTDYWHDFKDFLNYPDHGIGSIIGIRKYGILNNNNLVMGFEYARLLQSSFWNKRPTQNWYGNSLFNYSSYEGRRWAAHSGSDSDDLYINAMKMLVMIYQKSATNQTLMIKIVHQILDLLPGDEFAGDVLKNSVKKKKRPRKTSQRKKIIKKKVLKPLSPPKASLKKPIKKAVKQESNVDPKMATLTFVDILIRQKQYAKASSVLDLIKKKKTISQNSIKTRMKKIVEGLRENG